MLETSKDVLYLVLAFCLLLISVFLAWAIYYVAMILREFKKITADVRLKIELVEKILVAAKEKLESTSSRMKLLVETISNIAGYMKDRKQETKARAGKRENKKDKLSFRTK
jgi:hypothetical protein